MPNAPYLDSSVRWKIKSGGIPFRELRSSEVAEQLLDSGLVTEVLGPIGAGKEADIFLGRDGGQLVVAKVYRLYRTSNRSRGAVKADGMGFLAAREYELLGYASARRVPVPEPLLREENAFTMEFLGGPDGPAPQLRRAPLEDPGTVAQEVLQAVEGLADAGVVHTDLSPFNILVHRGHPYLIDLAAGLRVDRLGSPPWVRATEARAALRRGFEVLAKFFEHRGATFDFAPVLDRILKEIDRAGVASDTP